MDGKLKAAAIGGVVAGVLSVIPIVSVCFCLWAIGGGLLAGYLFIKDSAAPVTAGGGAAVGAMAGGVGAAIYFLFSLLFMVAFGTAASLDSQFRRAGVNLPFNGIVLMLISAIIGAIIIIGLAAVGGLIAVPIFEKRKGGLEPPPPPTGFAA